MFKFFATKAFFKIIPILSLVLFVLLFFYSYQIDQKNKTLSPEDVAFVNTIGAPQIAQSMGGNPNPLEKENIAGRELAKILNEMLAETLNFNKDNYAIHKQAVSAYFTSGAYKQYLAFLKSAGFDDHLVSQDLQSGIFIERPPLEVSSGVFNGAYKWLFEVPVAINFIPRDLQSYKGIAPSSLNRRATLRIQFTRVLDVNDPDAVKIEIWQAVSRR